MSKGDSSFMGKKSSSGSIHLRLKQGSKLSPDEAKSRLLEFIRGGHSVEDATAMVGKSAKTLYYYTTSDPEFKREYDLIRALRARDGNVSPEDRAMSFRDFRKEFMKSETFAHQQNIIDLIENKTPSWLHPSMLFEKGI